MTNRHVERSHGSSVVELDPFQFLLSEHAFLRAKLRRAMETAEAKTATSRTRDALATLSSAARHHMKAEEATLYPVSERLFGPYGAMLVLRKDHAVIEANLSSSGSMASRTLPGWLESLAVDLEAHLGREERVLFPMLSALMSGEELDRLARGLRSTMSH